MKVPAGSVTIPPPRCPAVLMAFWMAALSSADPLATAPCTGTLAVAVDPVAEHVKTLTAAPVAVFRDPAIAPDPVLAAVLPVRAAIEIDESRPTARARLFGR